MTDLLFALLHHLAIFSLFGYFVAEVSLVREGMSPAQAGQLAQVDRAYGMLSLAVLAIGFARAILAAKGWDYYAHNGFFWAKIAAFAAVGALSVVPTLRYIAWRRSGQAPDAAEVARVRRYLLAQLVLFAFIPLFAAAMARGYGQWA